MCHYLGIDVGGTNIRAALIGRTGEMSPVLKERTSREGHGEGMMEQIISMCRILTARTSAVAAGICLPGVFMPDGTLAHATNLPTGSERLHIVEQLRDVLNIPVYGENDANAAAFGEYVYGVGKGVESMYYVTISTGIGGGFIWNGNIIRGFNGFAGEVGSVLVTEEEASFRSLAPGSAEGCSGGDGILEKARKRINCEIRDAGEVFQLAQEGDEKAAEIVAEMITGLAKMFADIACVINPQRFVLGGGCMRSEDCFFGRMTELYRKLVPGSLKNTEFVQASLREPGLLGCAAIAGKGEKYV